MFGSIEDKKTRYSVIGGLVLLLVAIATAVVFALKFNAINTKYASYQSELTSLREQVYENTEYIDYLETQAKKNTAYTNLLTDYEELEKVNNSNAKLLENIYVEDSLVNANPIDNFFSVNKMSSYSTATYDVREELREQAWKEEMEYVYKRAISLADKGDVKELEKSQALIYEYVKSEKAIYLMVPRGTQGSVDSHFISAEIYKERTFELNNIINVLGAETIYTFNSKEYLKLGKEIFLTENYYLDFYSVDETDDGFKITLYDLDKNILAEINSTSTPVVKYQNFGILVVKVKTSDKINDIYEFNTYNSEVKKYENVLYYDNGVKVVIDNKMLVLSEGYGNKEIQLERDWKSGKPENAVVGIEVFQDENYSNILKLSYKSNGNDGVVVEFIKLS